MTDRTIKKAKRNPGTIIKEGYFAIDWSFINKEGKEVFNPDFLGYGGLTVPAEISDLYDDPEQEYKHEEQLEVIQYNWDHPKVKHLSGLQNLTHDKYLHWILHKKLFHVTLKDIKDKLNPDFDYCFKYDENIHTPNMVNTFVQKKKEPQVYVTSILIMAKDMYFMSESPEIEKKYKRPWWTCVGGSSGCCSNYINEYKNWEVPENDLSDFLIYISAMPGMVIIKEVKKSFSGRWVCSEHTPIIDILNLLDKIPSVKDPLKDKYKVPESISIEPVCSFR